MFPYLHIYSVSLRTEEPYVSLSSAFDDVKHHRWVGRAESFSQPIVDHRDAYEHGCVRGAFSRKSYELAERSSVLGTCRGRCLVAAIDRKRTKPAKEGACVMYAVSPHDLP
jgi:hypothetical protein